MMSSQVGDNGKVDYNHDASNGVSLMPLPDGTATLEELSARLNAIRDSL